FPLLIATAERAGAQRVLGPWEDASIAPRGVLRAEIATTWTRANERFARTGDGTEPLGTDFSLQALDASIIESLNGLAPRLSTLTGGPVPSLTLGGLEVRLEQTEYITPITLELGLTSRLAVRAVIPYVKNRVEVFPAPNTARTGNMGVNPALEVPAARMQNGLVVSQLTTAANRLNAELARCLGSTDPSCSAINADRAAASTLAQNALAAASAVASVYGTASAAGSPLVPVAQTSIHQSILARLATFETQFTNFLGAPQSGTWISAAPVAAPPIAMADFQRVLTAPVFGIAGRPLADVEHSHLGDIEVGAKLVLFDTFGHIPGRPTPRRTLGLRMAVAGLYRLPTGQRDRTDDFADIGTGDVQPDIEARGFLDVMLGRAFWTSAVIRYARQLSDETTLRITDAPGMPFPARFRQQTATRDLGDVFEFEISPRVAPNETFSLSANYHYRSKAADTYSGFSGTVPGADGAPVMLDASTLGIQTATHQQRVGMALTFSTVRAYGERRSRWPMEVSLAHTQIIAGEGVPKTFATTVTFRVYRRLFGPNPMR
ncbi:MAG TPA: hypothetical protein VF178_11805, partial [Gemmatimonadaceae bacterium]